MWWALSYLAASRVAKARHLGAIRYETSAHFIVATDV